MRPVSLSSIGFMSLVFFLFSSVGLCFASVFTLNWDSHDLIFEKVDGYDRVKMVAAISLGEPGTPLLPSEFMQIAIPVGLEVERVEVISFEYQELPGTYKIYPAQPFYPLSSLPTEEENIEFVDPSLSVYESSSEYPGELAQVTNNGFLGGQHIAGVALYPLQYIPAQGRLVLYTQIEFELIFQPSSHFPAPINRRSERGARFYSDLVRSMVLNPEAVQLEAKGSMSQAEEVDYLMITDASFVSAFQELADWKIQKGISTQIKEVSWVLSNYPGYDDQEKIRNCIRDYYSNHGTKWVLLGGDTPILPHRIAPVMGENIPCDLYFSDLDSNWDANGNHVYGEYEDAVDMYPDLFVGRAPSSDISEAQTFVNKSLTYEIDPPTDYQTRILYAAEVLWPGTDAAELKNYIDSSFVPDHFEATKLYETSGNLNSTTFRDSLNQGRNIINHNGHGDYNALSLGSDSWFSSDMDDLTNAPRFSLFYTFGCITAAIDMDCIAEHFVNNPNGGGFAYCGNTRFGWGIPGAPLEGPGPEFDIEFFRALFDSANYQVGKTLGNSKLPFIPISQEPSGGGPYYRWTMFTLLLLGDPTLELWTDTPAELSVSHDPVFLAGMSYFNVNVVEDSALVSCVKDGQILGTSYSSGGSATVYFDSALVTMGTMHVTATKHDYMPYHDTVLVIPPEGPYVIYQSHEIDDSQGNNNGVVNPDETILMSVTVKNIGIETAYGVSATLREEDDYIVVTDSVKSFGDIDSGMTAQSLDDYVFEVDPSCPDSHLVEFSLEATDGETSWVSSFSQMVVEPDFVITAIPDTAVVPKGDSTVIKLIFTSAGGFNSQVDLTHTALPPEVSGFLDPDQLIPTDSSIFRIYATEEADTGIYPITVTASGGGVTREKEVVLAILPPGYYGPVWYVSTEGDDSTGNGSQEFPFRTIQKGIESAADGDTVLATPGTYNEHINFDGKAMLVTSQAGAESTAISKLYDDLPIVTFDSGEDSNSILDGFTIQNANNPDGYGGAIQCYDHSSPTIRNNVLKDNLAGGGGGVDVRFYCSPIIENNRIIGNSSSGSGGGILCHDQSSPTISQNLFIENTAVWMGGGIYCRYDCQPTISQNWFIENSAGNDGGGIYCREFSSPTISQNLFIQNYAGKAGGAIYCFDSSSPVIVANTLDRNTSNEWGGSITCHSSSSPDIRNTIVSNELMGYGIYAAENSYPTVTYCDVWNNASGNFSGCTPGEGCISDDPVFCDPESGNYYLQNTSPCAGAGQGGSDIGALPAGCMRGDANGDGIIDVGDLTYLINYLFIDGPAPDPLWVGDANSDGVVDIADVTYLTNYLFIDGPPPCGPQALPAFQPLGRG